MTGGRLPGRNGLLDRRPGVAMLIGVARRVMPLDRPIIPMFSRGEFIRFSGRSRNTPLVNVGILGRTGARCHG